MLVLLLFARVSLLFERVKLISHLFPPQALLLLCRPLAINCLHSSLLTTLPSYLFSCKMLGLIGEKMVKENTSTSSSLRKLNRVPSNWKAEIRQSQDIFDFWVMRLRSPHIFLSWLLIGAWWNHSNVKKQIFCYKESMFFSKLFCLWPFSFEISKASKWSIQLNQYQHEH